MPIYEYICQSCGEPLEQLQKLSDAPLTECPSCGESALKRKISAAGFRLAGGGWYETDFKSDGKRNIAGASGDSSSKKPGNGDSSSGKSSESPSTKSDDSKTKSPSSEGSKSTGAKPSGDSTLSPTKKSASSSD
ncbi:MAG: zinc ribbon domain-containing protein [Salinisphaera sp.]|jgi:putative FmdB family regulatory protein|nr:zinc ribbon domain-containing protein [Salinisphaera sp.]